MFTWGSKYLFGVFVAAFGGAAAYGLITGGSIVGVLSGGYKGGVGDHAGYGILMAVAFVTLFLGVVSVVTRDGDAEDMAALVGSEHVLAVKPPAGPSIMAPLTAFGLGSIAVGVSVSAAFLYLGIAILAVVALEWLIQVWSERATGDHEINQVIRNRVLGPVQVPMLSALAIAVVAIGISRVLLAVSKEGAVVAASVAAAFVFGAAVLIAKTKAPRAVVSALVSFGAVAVLAGGIVGAVAGEREELQHHGEEKHAKDGEAEGEGE